MSKIIFRDPNVTIFQSALFQTNSTVVRTEDVVLVVDPAWLPEEVANIRHYVESIREDRSLFLIFTHSDFDHIIGFKAFKADKVFMSDAMANNPQKEAVLSQMNEFDQQYYIKRPYPLEYPEGDFMVYRDGVQYRHNNTKMAFYLTPGHTSDSMMVVVWQLGLCIAGDYLSDIEFPFIYHSSIDYEQTLHKLPRIHDRNWFTRLIPGHGNPSLSITDWLQRRTESLAYLYAVRESIATEVPFDTDSLWKRYEFPHLQIKYHEQNVALMRREFEQGLWTWDPEALSFDLPGHVPSGEFPPRHTPPAEQEESEETE